MKVMLFLLLLPVNAVAEQWHIGGAVTDGQLGIHADVESGPYGLDIEADGERFLVNGRLRFLSLGGTSLWVGVGYITQTTYHTDVTADWDNQTIDKSHDALSLSVSAHHNSGVFVRYQWYELSQSYKFIRTEYSGACHRSLSYGCIPTDGGVAENKQVSFDTSEQLLTIGYRVEF